LSDDNLRVLAESYARAAFGSRDVYMAARIAPDLPSDWSVRVLTGIEALAQLSNGYVSVTPDNVQVNGNTGNEHARSEIASLLADKLGEAQSFALDIVYQEALDPIVALPEPEECIAQIADIQEGSKIAFEPGNATINASALDAVDAIAEVLKNCGPIRLEIQGHTDSQGREIMNQNLSQARAQSVLNELRARRVLTATYGAKGYGESTPIADNGTEEGREANRRIEFVLLRPPSSAIEPETTLEGTAASPNASGEETTTQEGADE
jgi:OOP family OmpA-OmpF porin